MYVCMCTSVRCDAKRTTDSTNTWTGWLGIRSRSHLPAYPLEGHALTKHLKAAVPWRRLEDYPATRRRRKLLVRAAVEMRLLVERHRSAAGVHGESHRAAQEMRAITAGRLVIRGRFLISSSGVVDLAAGILNWFLELFVRRLSVSKQASGP